MKWSIVVVIALSLFAQTQTKPVVPKAGLNAATASTVSPSVTLTCNAPVGPPAATGFNFYRGTVKGGPYPTLAGNASTCSYSDTTVSYGATYFYVATAVNSVGCPTGKTCESSFSNEVQAVMPASGPIPGPPTNLTAGAVIAHNVPLNWQAPVNEVVHAYRVYRRPYNKPEWTEIVAGIKQPDYLDEPPRSAIYQYEVKANVAVGKKFVLSAASNVVQVIVP